MELESGWRLLKQQFTALFLKNFLLSWRNKRATFLQLFSSLFFLLLIFCIQKAIESSLRSSTAYRSILSPTTLSDPPIPPCEDKYFVSLPCFDFVWSGNDSRRISQIVDRILVNNPGRPIPSNKVQSFRTPNEVNIWLFKNPMHCPGALHFLEKNATVISYGIQTNSSLVLNSGNSEDPTFKFQIPLQLAAEREIARSLIGDLRFSWAVSFMEYAHPAKEIFNAVAAAGPTFFLATAMFGFVFQISSLIAEKELKLRQAMTLMGLYETAYWLSWFTWEGLITLLSSLFIVLFGMMFRFNFFLGNSFAVLFLLFFLFQLNMITFAFMLSAFVKKSSSSTVIGYSVFIIGFLTQLVTAFGFPFSRNFSSGYRVIWSFFPPNLFAEALKQLSRATGTPSDPGISWSRRTECAPNYGGCLITINDIYLWLLSTFFLWFALAIYFDNIIPNSSGVRKSVLYFLKPEYWTGKGGNKEEEGSFCSCRSSVPSLQNISPDDKDVLEEENKVKQQMVENLVDPNVAIQIRGLVKIYPGKTKISRCNCKRTSPYHVLKDLWVNIAKDQLFCLLGPNGAGKTTAINCLTGITPVTCGDALMYGFSVRSSSGMSNIRRMIGVCPQFDTLWDSLSGQEHLHLFASIKGLTPTSIESIVEKSLADVKLTEASRMRVSSYSGGMKRRLSVAIALIGGPKLVILDEPTTGMDPISRRHVWDIIEIAKKGRAIILTTHSMEEADVLSDRIGIMAKGRLRCIGNSLRLKSRFGTGFITNLSFSGDIGRISTNEDISTAAQHEALKQFFRQHLDVLPKEENKSFLTYVIPHDKESLLKNFFASLQERAEEFRIADIQLGLATLEEVFLNIAKKAALEEADTEGRFATLTLNSGLSVQVPVGGRYIGIQGTESAENPRGVMVEVHWEQDDSGALCISNHSPEMPIPAGVDLTTSASASESESTTTQAHSITNFWSKRKQRHGFVIDPAQINL